MPRAFSEEEKGRIRALLIEAGKSCFTRYGLKKTTIDDLVKPAGIAKSSFYLFFDSKETLYIECLLDEMPAMITRLVDGSFGTADNTRDAIALLVKAIAHEVSTNEFSRVLLDDPQELRRIAGTLDFDDILRRAMSPYAPLLKTIMDAQARGEIIEGNPQEILFSMGLIKLLAFNRQSMPKELYGSMIEFVPNVIADGLTHGCANARRPATESSEPALQEAHGG